jgi:hypothetical protein
MNHYNTSPTASGSSSRTPGSSTQSSVSFFAFSLGLHAHFCPLSGASCHLHRRFVVVVANHLHGSSPPPTTATLSVLIRQITFVRSLSQEMGTPNMVGISDSPKLTPLELWLAAVLLITIGPSPNISIMTTDHTNADNITSDGLGDFFASEPSTGCAECRLRHQILCFVAHQVPSSLLILFVERVYCN